jgi:hypothetical protein
MRLPSRTSPHRAFGATLVKARFRRSDVIGHEKRSAGEFKVSPHEMAKCIYRGPCPSLKTSRSCQRMCDERNDSELGSWLEKYGPSWHPPVKITSA